MPRVYDVLMCPLEAAGLARARAALWSDVPRTGIGLEIGAGTGASGRHRPSSAQLIRTDVSHAALARARASRDGASAQPAAVADVEALPFPTGTFDWAAGSLLFCEVADPLAGLRELRRVIRPGGSLHLLEHVEPHGRIGAALARGLSALTGPLFGEHFDRRTHETVDAAGFTRERTDWAFGGALVRMIARR